MPDATRAGTIVVTVEAGAKKVFASALDWPGWSRSGKTDEAALTALAAYADRYAVVAREATEPFEAGAYEVVEHTGGGSGTDFGVPSSITDLDHRPADSPEADRQSRLVAAAWVVLDRVAAGAPAELRKGPRGGDTAGRSTASVTVTPGPTSTTFSITAVTPDRSDGTDRDPVHLDMTVTCPT